jgi:hypothetical protein
MKLGDDVSDGPADARRPSAISRSNGTASAARLSAALE